MARYALIDLAGTSVENVFVGDQSFADYLINVQGREVVGPLASNVQVAPGWGFSPPSTFTATVSAAVARRVPQPLGLEYGPVALWAFQDSLADSSGNGLDLVLGAGSPVFADVLPGLRGVFFDGVTFFERLANDPLLTIIGDLTVETIMYWESPPTDGRVVVSFGGAGETEATNVLYDLSTRSPIPQPTFFCERLVGVDQSAVLLGESLPVGIPCLWAVTRTAAGLVSQYLNGRLIGTTALLGATGGTSSRLRVGTNDFEGANRTLLNAACASIKILPVVLTPEQVADEYTRTLGGLFPTEVS